MFSKWLQPWFLCILKDECVCQIIFYAHDYRICLKRQIACLFLFDNLDIINNNRLFSKLPLPIFPFIYFSPFVFFLLLFLFLLYSFFLRIFPCSFERRRPPPRLLSSSAPPPPSSTTLALLLLAQPARSASTAHFHNATRRLAAPAHDNTFALLVRPTTRSPARPPSTRDAPVQQLPRFRLPTPNYWRHPCIGHPTPAARLPLPPGSHHHLALNAAPLSCPHPTMGPTEGRMGRKSRGADFTGFLPLQLL